jgi:hypothetical protein
MSPKIIGSYQRSTTVVANIDSRRGALSGSMDRHAIGRTPGHHDDASLGDVMVSAILLEIVADTHAIVQCDDLVENSTPNPTLPSDDAIVENNRAFDYAPAIHVDTSPEYRAANYAPARTHPLQMTEPMA